jgi:hypothetical protein
VLLLRSMVIKLKLRWQNSGQNRLAFVASLGLWSKLASPVKKPYGHQERDEPKRPAFAQELAQLRPEDLVYADEAGMDERDEYEYGYLVKNVCCRRSVAKRVSSLAGGKGLRIHSQASFSSTGVCSPLTTGQARSH